MRPEILFPLLASTEGLPGVGPKVKRLTDKLAGERVIDLVWHKPTGLVDRSAMPDIADALPGSIVTLKVRVLRHVIPRGPRQPYRVYCADDTGDLALVYFNARGDYLAKLLPVDSERIVSGRVERFNDGLQMTHPDHVVEAEKLDEVRGIEPVYPMTAGLSDKVLAKAIRAAIDRAPELPEWLQQSVLDRAGWLPWRAAVEALHAPQSDGDLSALSVVRQRLAYDELLANQLALGLMRERQRRLPGRTFKPKGAIRAKILAALPYALTNSQVMALAEIDGDMGSSSRMLRLLQGDVGSGKTIVALLTLANAIECGAQTALMAPTEILARQHLETISPLAEKAGIRVALLTGRDKGKAREALLARIVAGEVDLVIGTHALFQEDIAFADLGAAVIDEQHRFGVHQRLTLASKGRGVDVLVMTATPIPRTLMLTSYGDLDVSRLTEKPAGRQPITTIAMPLDRMSDVVQAVRRAISGGARAYWVCPLVEQSELLDVAAAADRFEMLRELFGERVGLVHGKLKAADKDRAMADFAEGRLDILVATTVIEVGVNVPAATVMVIEHAERFGLAQLHQLRGRIGRGSGASTCLLLYQGPLGQIARERIETMRATEDGFRIAEEDLRLRGAGEVLGTRQSGLPEFRLADVAVHGELLAMARDDAKMILAADPMLETERGKALRVLLYLFERDAAVQYLRSG